MNDASLLRSRPGLNFAGKLLLVTLTVALTAGQLLALRHERQLLINETIRTHEQMKRAEESLWMLRAEIARRTTPEALDQLIDADAPTWHPIADPMTRTIDLRRPPTNGIADIEPEETDAEAHAES